MEVPENEGEEYEEHHDENFMKMVSFEMTLNTITKIFVNNKFHSTMALRTLLVKTIVT